MKEQNSLNNDEYRSRKQSSLDPAESLKRQGSLVEDEQKRRKNNPVLFFGAAVLILLAAVGIYGALADHSKPVHEEVQENTEEAGSTQDTVAEDEPTTEDEQKAEESAQESSVEEEPEPAVEIISPESFGDQTCYYESDRYITNISHYTDGRLIGSRQEAVVIPWAFFNSLYSSPVFINHMSEYLSVSYDGNGSFPYTDFTLTFESDSAEDLYKRDLDFTKDYQDSYQEVQFSELFPYETLIGEKYMIYQKYVRRDSGPSMETYALRDIGGGGILKICLDQFYTSSVQAEYDFTVSTKVEELPDPLMKLLDSLSFYYGEDLYEIRAASPSAKQAYYSYDTGLTVFTHISSSEVSLPLFGYDNYYMTDNTQTLRFSEYGINSSKGYGFMYFEPSIDGKYQAYSSYYVTEHVSYEFFDMTEKNYMTLLVMDESKQPTGEKAGPIHSYDIGTYSVYARYLEDIEPGSNYPYGDATVIVWIPLSGNTGLAIRDHLCNFGDGPSQDVDTIVMRLMNTVEIW